MGYAGVVTFNGTPGIPWFGFSRTFEWVSHDCLNQVEHPDCNGTLAFHPEPEVLQELRLKYRNPFRLSLHRAFLFAMRLLSRV